VSRFLRDVARGDWWAATLVIGLGIAVVALASESYWLAVLGLVVALIAFPKLRRRYRQPS